MQRFILGLLSILITINILWPEVTVYEFPCELGPREILQYKWINISKPKFKILDIASNASRVCTTGDEKICGRDFFTVTGKITTPGELLVALDAPTEIIIHTYDLDTLVMWSPLLGFLVGLAYIA